MHWKTRTEMAYPRDYHIDRLLSSYDVYTTVTGWMLHYFYMTVTGQFQGLDADGVSGQFTTMLSKPLTMGFWMVVVVCAGVFVCSRGLQNGLEK